MSLASPIASGPGAVGRTAAIDTTGVTLGAGPAGTRVVALHVETGTARWRRGSSADAADYEELPVGTYRSIVVTPEPGTVGGRSDLHVWAASGTTTVSGDWSP